MRHGYSKIFITPPWPVTVGRTASAVAGYFELISRSQGSRSRKTGGGRCPLDGPWVLSQEIREKREQLRVVKPSVCRYRKKKKFVLLKLALRSLFFFWTLGLL